MDGIFQPTHIILILVAALIIFGPKRLPDIGKSLGKGIKEFKGALTHTGDDDAPVTTTVVTPAMPPAMPAPAQATTVEAPAAPAPTVAETPTDQTQA